MIAKKNQLCKAKNTKILEKDFEFGKICILYKL